VWEFSYGARYLRFKDDFRVVAMGGILGDLFPLLGVDGDGDDTDGDGVVVDDYDNYWNTLIENQIIGPQVGLKYSHMRGRWTITTQGKFAFGYNVQDHRQDGLLGPALEPELLLVEGTVEGPDGEEQDVVFVFPDSPLPFFQTTSFRHGKQEHNFSPLVEFRINASYHVTRSVALQFGYNAVFIDNVRRAARQVNYHVPDMGFINGGTQELFASGVNFGIEFNH
jgi:hypothetical protein